MSVIRFAIPGFYRAVLQCATGTAQLESAARWNIPAVLLVNNNRSLNMEIDLYTDAYGGKLEANHGELWKFTDVSFAAVAEKMGVLGIRVEQPGELPGALDRAFSANRPCVVEVMTEIEALAPVALVP